MGHGMHKDLIVRVLLGCASQRGFDTESREIPIDAPLSIDHAKHFDGVVVEVTVGGGGGEEEGSGENRNGMHIEEEKRGSIETNRRRRTGVERDKCAQDGEKETARKMRRTRPRGLIHSHIQFNLLYHHML